MNKSHSTPILTLTLDQLEEVLFPIIQGILKDMFEPILKAIAAQSQSKLSEFVNGKEALALLRVSKPTLNKLRKQGLINSYPSSKRRVLYKRSELIAYLESNKREGMKK